MHVFIRKHRGNTYTQTDRSYIRSQTQVIHTDMPDTCIHSFFHALSGVSLSSRSEHMYTYARTYIHTYIHIYIYIYIHIHIQSVSFIHAVSRVSLRLRSEYVHTYIHTYIYTHMHTFPTHSHSFMHY